PPPDPPSPTTCASLPKTSATTEASRSMPMPIPQRSSAASARARGYGPANQSRSRLTRAHSTSSTRRPGSEITTELDRREPNDPHTHRGHRPHLSDCPARRRACGRRNERQSEYKLEQGKPCRLRLGDVRRHLDRRW